MSTRPTASSASGSNFSSCRNGFLPSLDPQFPLRGSDSLFCSLDLEMMGGKGRLLVDALRRAWHVRKCADTVA